MIQQTTLSKLLLLQQIMELTHSVMDNLLKELCIEFQWNAPTEVKLSKCRPMVLHRILLTMQLPLTLIPKVQQQQDM